MPLITAAPRNTLLCEHATIKNRRFTASFKDMLLPRETHKRDSGSDAIRPLARRAPRAELTASLRRDRASSCRTDLVLPALSACSESLDISISLIASLTSSFSTESTMRRRACRKAKKRILDVVLKENNEVKNQDQNQIDLSFWSFLKLRCAGTVRPRQVQCPLGWPAIAQVSASQHQLVPLHVWGGGSGADADDSSGHGQLCMGLHSCS